MSSCELPEWLDEWHLFGVLGLLLCSCYYFICFLYWDHKSYWNLIDAIAPSLLKNIHIILHSILGVHNHNLKIATMLKISHTLRCWMLDYQEEWFSFRHRNLSAQVWQELHVKEQQRCVCTHLSARLHWEKNGHSNQRALTLSPSPK
jgi:hypothetical protein